MRRDRWERLRQTARFESFALREPPGISETWTASIGLLYEEGPQLELPTTPHLNFGYVVGTDPYGERKIDFTERLTSAPQSQLELAKFEGLSTPEKVMIDGSLRDVYLLDVDAEDAPITFAVMIGNTIVSGSADLGKTQTLVMLSSLEKM